MIGFDYEKLLKAYMDVVFAHEGVFFIPNPLMGGTAWDKLGPEEKYELARLAEEVRGGAGTKE